MKITRFLIFLVIIILIVNLAYFYPRLTGKGFYEPEIANVTRVIDGDTFETDGGNVRLLCLNTPEKNKPYYDEAKIFLAEFEGKQVQILRDSDDEDRYNRKLRFVFLGKKFINKGLIENGLAHLYLCEGTYYYKDLKKAENSAIEKQAGLWKKSTSKCSKCIKLINLDPELEYFILKNTCSHKCEFEGKDEANHFFQISLEGREEKIIESKGNIWNNDGDRLFLRDDKGLLLYYEY